MMVPRREAGFTLVELVVALALFALISLAGVALVESVLGIQRRTDGRLDRLRDMQRAMHFVSADFDQLTDGPRRQGNEVGIRRVGIGGRERAVAYALRDAALVRSVDGATRQLLVGVASLSWRFHHADAGWSGQPTTDRNRRRPDAVELSVVMRDGRTLRRLVAVPAEP